MDDTELEENFLYACLKYAIDHGGVEVNYTTFSPKYIGLENRKGKHFIVRWDHPSPQPSEEELKKYSVEDLHLTIDMYDHHTRLARSLCAYTMLSDHDLEVMKLGATFGNLVCEWEGSECALSVLDMTNTWYPIYSTPNFKGTIRRPPEDSSGSGPIPGPSGPIVDPPGPTGPSHGI